MDDSATRAARAIEAFRSGKMVILVDDQDRENEGDLCVAAEKCTPDAINFMATHGRGLICLALTEEQITKLQLPMMVADNQAPLGTAFTVSVEARHGVSTGISAKDRATTVAAAVADDARPEDLVSPGHVFPLRARPGGVLVRTGQTEGSVDLARLAGLKPSAVICETMRDDGEMARMPDLEKFSAEHDIIIVTIADLIAYRLQREKIVKPGPEVGQIRPPFLGSGPAWSTYLYSTDVEETEYLALVRGDVRGAAAAGEAVPVRVHTASPAADALMTRPELVSSMSYIDNQGVGVVLYVFNKRRASLAKAYANGLVRRPVAAAKPVAEQSEALRDFGLGAQVLADVGCQKIRLLSNTDRKIVGIAGFGIDIVERIGIPEMTNPGRFLTLPGGAAGAATKKKDEG
jgi:3,4-dihydroxy 2-butanone 4-phosphate synthase/GTP cyclohydrolase II